MLDASAAIAAGEPALAARSDGSDQYLRRPACPCCGAPLSRARPKAASSPPAESLGLEFHGQFLSGYSKQRVFFTYFECSACEVKYCPTYYTQAQLDRLYSRQAENMEEVPLEARRRTQADYAALLMRHSRMAGNFLEIGPDIGLFARTCAEKGHFQHFWLYEPNREVHPKLAENFRNRSYSISANNFNAADVPRENISTAVLIHVLDHLLNPGDFLKEIATSLEPGGILFTVTHDSNSLLAKLLGSRWPPYTLQHPLLFSARSISRLLNSSGFEVLAIDKSTNYFPITHFARAGFAVFGLRGDLVPAWQRPLIGLKLGNIATIARKRR
jgi:2-polyprenyl-3-methyl-5-hydroxy-6-metoxy-1,4-benzoquinol methylase